MSSSRRGASREATPSDRRAFSAMAGSRARRVNAPLSAVPPCEALMPALAIVPKRAVVSSRSTPRLAAIGATYLDASPSSAMFVLLDALAFANTSATRAA